MITEIKGSDLPLEAKYGRILRNYEDYAQVRKV